MKSMVILLDTNIILDYLDKRVDFSQAAKNILTICATEKVTGYIAFHSVSNIFYILRKNYSEEKRREMLGSILDILKVTGASHSRVRSALMRENFKDFEDCLQDECAKEVQADYIITRNVTDFAYSDTKAITPEDFLQKII